MASSIGLSATRMNLGSKDYVAEVSGIAEGAVVIASAADDQQVKLPAGAASARVMGVCASGFGVGGSSATGDLVNVQKLGQAMVLLAAGATVARGDELITANSSGHVKARTAETGCTIVARSECAHTAGATAEMIPAWLILSNI